MSIGTRAEDCAWLVSDAGREWLARAEGWRAEGLRDPLRLLKSLRKELSAGRASLILDQLDLRQRALRKFPRANELFFTRQALEQATDAAIATYKAARFRSLGRCVDFCCGIGGDLMALAETTSPTLGIERDSAVAFFARANVATNAPGWGESGGDVHVRDAQEVDLAEFDVWHADPDRRATGKRVTTKELYEPSFEVMRAWWSTGRAGGIKLAPATDPPALDKWPVEYEWLGSRGECRQLVLWVNGAARYPGLKTATACESRGTATLVERPGVRAKRVATCEAYLYEAHAAVLAAKLEVSLADHFGISIWPGVAGYFTGTQSIDSPLLSSYRVLASLPFDRRKVREWLRAHGIGRVTIKKRGVELDVPRVEKELAGPGDESAYLILAPHHDSIVAVVAK
ncbi:MAG: hypothetical protein U1A77_07845 [Pirellulales bacterium]